MSRKVGLIAGATGAIGSAIARELAPRDDWKVLGISRNPAVDPVDGVEYHLIDLNDSETVVVAFSDLAPVTHLFYSGRVTHAEQVIEDPTANLRLLDHLVHALEAGGHPLQHVHLVQGGKVYGVHIGPFSTPAKESDPRLPIENFNYDQEDYLREHSRNASWTWSASRPNTLMHCSPGNGRNLVSSIGSYAAICREQGTALDFPGVAGAWGSSTQLTTLALLASAIAWIVQKPDCANQAFNLTNTDVLRWGHLWPAIADFFDMPCGEIQTQRLAGIMPQRKAVWQSIANRHRLRFDNLDQLANWGYLDATLERYWDELFSHEKIHASGFTESDDSEARFLQLLGQYRDEGILP